MSAGDECDPGVTATTVEDGDEDAASRSRLIDNLAQLSGPTLVALQQFMDEERYSRRPASSGVNPGSPGTTEDIDEFREVWQLSQFWYTEETARKLGEYLLASSGEERSVAIISAPSVYVSLPVERRAGVTLFEYDKRFSRYPGFIHYDYRDPPTENSTIRSRYDIILFDPPFLAEECFEKVWKFVEFLRRDGGCRVVASTGMMMKTWLRGRGLRATRFRPKHRRKLENEFGCFTSWSGPVEFEWQE